MTVFYEMLISDEFQRPPTDKESECVCEGVIEREIEANKFEEKVGCRSD